MWSWWRIFACTSSKNNLVDIPYCALPPQLWGRAVVLHFRFEKICHTSACTHATHNLARIPSFAVPSLEPPFRSHNFWSHLLTPLGCTSSCMCSIGILPDNPENIWTRENICPRLLENGKYLPENICRARVSPQPLPCFPTLYHPLDEVLHAGNHLHTQHRRR